MLWPNSSWAGMMWDFHIISTSSCHCSLYKSTKWLLGRGLQSDAMRRILIPMNHTGLHRYQAEAMVLRDRCLITDNHKPKPYTLTLSTRTQSLQSPHPSSEFQTRKRWKVSERRQNRSLSSSQRISGLNGITEALLGWWELTSRGVWECEGSARRAWNTTEYTESAFHPSGLSIATCSSDWGQISISAGASSWLQGWCTW